MGEIEKIQVKNFSETCVIWPDHLKDLQKAIKLIGSGKKVLDAGCSDGQVMEMIKQKGNKVWGIDLSKKALKNAAAKGLDVKFGRIQKIPFKDNFFDVVFCSHTIEHIFDSQNAFSEFYRVLKKNGTVIVLTENLNSLKERILFLFGRMPTVMNDPAHAKFFNIARLKKELIKAGFGIDAVLGSQIGIPVKGHCFFTYRFEFMFPVWLKEKLIIKAGKS